MVPGKGVLPTAALPAGGVSFAARPGCPPKSGRIGVPVSRSLMRAGVTLYIGLRHSGYRRDDTPGAILLGGFGHLGVLYATAMGARADCCVFNSTKGARRSQFLTLRFSLILSQGDAAQKLRVGMVEQKTSLSLGQHDGGSGRWSLLHKSVQFSDAVPLPESEPRIVGIHLVVPLVHNIEVAQL